MPNIATIDNGESGLSVRNKLNDLIDYVNTGTTYASGYTYITEGTTPGSEFVNILSPRDVYISGGTSVELEYYGSPTITGYLLLNNTETTLHMDDNGVDSSTLTLTPTDITSTSTDGTNVNTQTITPNGTNILIEDGVTNQSTFDLQDTSFILTIFDNTNTGQFEVGSTYVTTTSNDGFNTATLNVSNNGNIELISDDGTNTNSQILTTSGVATQISDGVDNNSVNYQKNYSLNEIVNEIYSGTSNAYSAETSAVKGVYTFIIPTDDAVVYFNASNNIVIYKLVNGNFYYLDVDVNLVTTTAPGVDGYVNGTTRVRIGNPIGGINVANGDMVYIYTPSLGGSGTFTIPQYQLTTTFQLDPTQSVSNTNFDINDGINRSNYITSQYSINMYSQDDLTNSSTIELTPKQSYFSTGNENGQYSGGLYFNMTGIDKIDTTLSVYNDMSGGGSSIELVSDASLSPNSYININTSSDLGNSNITKNGGSLFISSEDTTATALTTIQLDPTESNLGTFWLADNGTWSSKLSLDPSDNFDQTGLVTTDGTNNNFVLVRQSGVAITAADGVNSIDLSFTPTELTLIGIPSFDDDTAASGLTAGSIYQTTGNGASPLDVAGILMIKQ